MRLCTPLCTRRGSSSCCGANTCDFSAPLAGYWSEWQDLNLRPPRPERGDLPGRPLKHQHFSTRFNGLCLALFTGFRCHNGAMSACRSGPRLCRPGDAVMAAPALCWKSHSQRLDGHAQIARDLPRISTVLHRPCRGRVAQDVWCGSYPSVLRGRCKSLARRPHRCRRHHALARVLAPQGMVSFSTTKLKGGQPGGRRPAEDT